MQLIYSTSTSFELSLNKSIVLFNDQSTKVIMKEECFIETKRKEQTNCYQIAAPTLVERIFLFSRAIKFKIS